MNPKSTASANDNLSYEAALTADLDILAPIAKAFDWECLVGGAGWYRLGRRYDVAWQEDAGVPSWDLSILAEDDAIEGVFLSNHTDLEGVAAAIIEHAAEMAKSALGTAILRRDRQLQ